jgi:hypothetical protein
VAGTLGLPSVHYLDLTGIWVPGDLGSNSALSSFPALTSRSFYLTCTMGTPMTKWDSSRWGTFQMSFVWKGPRLLLLNHTPWLLPLRMGTFNNFFFFDGAGVWTQGFVFAKQELYPLSHTSSPFCFGYFGDGISQTICLVGLEPQSSWSQPPK